MYRTTAPVQNFAQMAFCHNKLSHTIIKIFRIKLTEHLMDVFPTYIANIKKFKHVVIEIWALKENCSQWKKRQHSNAFCHCLDKWSHYYAVFVMMKNKQKLYFLYYYKTITHFKNIKCQIYHLKLFIHILAE